MEGNNTFEKGLHRSNTPQMQPEGSYVDALNWIRNDSGRLVNEELEEMAQSLTDGTYELLGYCPIQDSFICFFKQNTLYSEIGIFDNITKQYTRIFNDFFHNYKLEFKNSIDSVARIVGTISNSSTSPSGDRIVYFVEKDNSIRRFNIDLFLKDRSALSPTGAYTYSSINYDRVEDFDLQLTIQLPYGKIDVVNTGGSLPSGVYAVVFRYRTLENNPTIFGIPTKFYFINDDPGITEEDDGCPPGTQTSKLIKITLTNTDSNYPFIEPVIITYTGTTNVLTIKSLGTYANDINNQIIFSDESQYKDDVPLTQITESPTFYKSAECIEQKDNILVLSNITTKSYDESFQEIANNIDVYCYFEEVDVTRTPFFNYKPRTDIVGVWFDSGDNLQVDSAKQYYNRYHSNSNFTDVQTDTGTKVNYPYKDNSLEKGFQRGEIYSFSITPIYKDGSIGFAYHIPAKPSTSYNTSFPSLLKTGIYTSDFEYPDYLQNNFSVFQGTNNNKIRHHKMPDYNDSGYQPLVQSKIVGSTTYKKINILRVAFENINLSSQINNIQGYIIGYQSRNSAANKRIIDHGFIRPYLQNGNNKIGNASNGSLFLKTVGNHSFTPDIWNGVYQYFSPHSSPFPFFDRNIDTSYFLEIYGLATAINLSPRTFYMDWNGDAIYLFFDQWDEVTQGQFAKDIKLNGGDYYINWKNNNAKDRITKVIKVPQTGDHIYVDGAYRVNNNTSYVHLTTQSSLFLSIDWPNWYLPDDNGRKLPAWIWNERSEKWFGHKYLAKPFYVLARILNETTTQYGRLEQAEYTPKKVFFKDSNNALPTSTLLEGDIFLTSHSYIHRDGILEHPFSNNNVTPMNTLVTMWCESDINFHMRHQEPNSYPYYPKTKALIGPGSITTGGLWYGQRLEYNTQYSAESNIKKNFSKPLFFNEATNFPNRSVYSKQSFEGELTDQYRIFPFTQYHDIPKDRGEIIDTFVFNNNFYHHTEYGLWLSYFNPNTTQATSQGKIILGNAGIFQLPSKLILDIKGGYMGTMDKSGTNTPFGRVFLDHKQGKIFLLTGEAPIEISDLGLFSLFRDFVNVNSKYSMGYDWANKRLLINNITQGKAVSYYPKTQTWTSFHDFSPNAYFTTNGYSYAFKNNSFYNLNNATDIRKNSYITYVENTSPDTFKRFDRIEMNTMSGGKNTTGSPGFVEPIDYVFLDKSFTHIHAWTDRQNTTELPFSYSHDYNINFLASYETDKVPVNYYRSSFHAELPLDAVVDPYKNIFDGNNTNINADFRAHMKGKFLYTKLSYNDSKPLVLNYVKTFFKPTVA